MLINNADAKAETLRVQQGHKHRRNQHAYINGLLVLPDRSNTDFNRTREQFKEEYGLTIEEMIAKNTYNLC
jgi:hypothetical protein